ncbi:MAG: NFACT family protein [Chloroflexia bacterium]
MSISKFHETNNGKSVSTVWLHAELMGRHANLMLLDADRKTIIESVKRVTPEMSRVRPVLPQRPFSPPPPRAGIHAHRVTPDALEALVAAARENSTLVQVLVSGVAGLSPLSTREVVYRAGRDVGIKAAEWTDWPRLALELRRLASLWATREHRPFVARFEDGSTAYAPYELQHLAGSAELVEFTDE